MKPIINPWIMYVIGLSNNISDLFTAFLTILLSFIIAAVIIASIIFFENYNIDTFDAFLEDYHIAVKWFKRSCISVAIIGLVLLFMPSEKTLYSMVVLDNVTPDNIEAVGNTGKDVIDYIFDKIDQIKEEEKE